MDQVPVIADTTLASLKVSFESASAAICIFVPMSWDPKVWVKTQTEGGVEELCFFRVISD